MRKLVALILSLAAVSANAHGYYYYHHYHGGHDWVTPIIIGGVIGYGVARATTPPPVVVQPPVVTAPQQPYCPYPYQPFFNQVYTTDAYGNSVVVNQFMGCR